MEAVQVLHLGCVSSVFLASRPGLGQEPKIVKAYHKNNLQVRHWLNITREVATLRHLRDVGVPGVVDLCGTADDAANVYLVFEPCPGGDLYKRLSQKGLLSEAQLCKEVITPLLRVLHSLHQLGIIHRDIKPENIFFEADGSLRLGDFGLAINAARERPISRVGTLDYMAPEVLAQPSADVVAQRRIRTSQLPSYDAKVDIWALGVLAYEALMGVTPFSDADPSLSALKAQFRLPTPLHGGVSPACAHFVGLALTKQAVQRPSALQLLAHPWVRAHAGELEALPAGVRAGAGGAAARPHSEHAVPAAGGVCDGRLAADSAAVRAGPIPITKSCTPGHTEGISSCGGGRTQLSCSAPMVGVWMPRGSPHQGLLGGALRAPPAPVAAPPRPQAQPPPCQVVVSPKQQPQQHKPQQLPPHPFASAVGQGLLLEGRAQSSPVVLLGDDDGDDVGADDDLDLAAADDSGAAAGRGSGRGGACGQQHELLASCSQPSRHVSVARSFVRQLSSPVPVKGGAPGQECMQPAEPQQDPLDSPTPRRVSLLASSPVRALLGASRHLMRQRSGAAPPLLGATDGAAAAAAAAAAASSVRHGGQPGFLLRSPLPSPIRGLLSQRRKPPVVASASASASLFAAAQWRPAGCGGTGSGAGGSSGLASTASGPAGSSSKCDDCSSSLLRACSMEPTMVLGAGLVSCSSSSSSTHPGSLPGARSSNGGNAAAAPAAPGAVESQQAALHSSRSPQAGVCSRALALSRYPSAPDPGPMLLALSPVRGGARGATTAAAVAGVAGGAAGRTGPWAPEQPSRQLVFKQQPPPPQQQQQHHHQQQQPLLGAALAAATDAVHDQRPPSGLQGARGMSLWSKVQGMCRLGRHVAVEEDDLAGDAGCP